MDTPTLFKIIGIALYLVVLLGIGVVAARRMKDVKDYFAAGKRLGFLAVAFSARATGESAWLLLGLTGMGAAVGVKAFWVVAGEVLGVAGAWLLMSRRFHRLTMRYDAITVPDYLEARFADTTHLLRLVSAAALTVFVTIYVSAQIDATGQAFEQFLGWNYFVGAIVGFAVVMAYSVSGGFLAVAWSDVFQGSLMFLGLVVLPVVGVAAVGGWGEVMGGLEAIDPALTSASGALVFDPAGAALQVVDPTAVPTPETDWSLPTVLSILSLALIGLGFLGSPQIFVRFLALRDEREIGRGAFVAIVWTLLADSGAVVVGMAGRVLFTGGEDGGALEAVLGAGGEDVLPMLVAEIMPAFVVGLYIAIVLSAIMSTVDSLLVLAGSAAVRDVYQRVLRPETPDDALVPLSRKVTFALALVALAIALTVALVVPGRKIFWFVIFGWSGIAATFCPTLILSLFWRGLTRRGALAGMIAGFVGVPLFKFGATALPGVGPLFDALSELPPSFALSALVAILVSRLDPGRRAAAEAAAAELAHATARRPGQGPTAPPAAG